MTTHNRPAFTLIEVIIALFVIALTSTAATTLILQMNRSQNEEIHRIQAHLLIDEATTIVTMIRNSNYMRFANDTCWLVPLTEKNCDNPPKEIADIGSQHYLFTRNPSDMHFELIQETKGALDLKNGTNNDPYAVYRNDVPGAFSRGILYTPRPGTTKPANAQPEYWRMVTIEKGCTAIGYTEPEGQQRAITITTEVWWKIGSKPYRISRTACINNDRGS